MKISDLIKVSVEKGTVVFTSKDGNASVGVIGCSCTLAKKSKVGFDRTPIVVRPPSGIKMTVIGLVICYNQGQDTLITHEFIGISLSDKILYADLERHYTFDGGTISFGDRFPVVITLEDGRKFATYTEFSPIGKTPPEGFQLVDDPDLLFQFAAGAIDLETLESYATADKRTAESVEIGKLKQRISSLETELEEKTLTIADLRRELNAEKDTALVIEKKRRDLFESNMGLRKTLEDTYKVRDEYANTVGVLKRKNNKFVTLILDIEASVFRALMPWFLPWRTVSVCRKIVCRYADIVRE